MESKINSEFCVKTYFYKTPHKNLKNDRYFVKIFTLYSVSGILNLNLQNTSQKFKK